MFDEPSTMPSDCRVFYVYETTYMITAAIISATIQYPELRELPDYLDIMTKAFNGCMGRGFLGHGYDALEGFLSAMDIFAGSGIEKYLKIYGTEFPEFTAYWNEKVSILKEQILSGKWRTDWSNESKSKEAAVIISKLENER